MNSPANFSKFNLNTVREAKYFLSRYSKLFKWFDSEEVLEIGSADGRIAKDVLYPFIGKRLEKLTGSDNSQNAVDVANEVNAKANLSFERIDITEEGVGKKYEGRFGHVFAFLCFHMIPFPERWSKNIFDMLKPGGQFFASMIIFPHPYPSTAKAQKDDKSAPWAKYIANCPDLFIDYRPQPEEKIKKILTTAGFTVEVIEVVNNEHTRSTFPTFKELDGTMLGANSYLKHIPEELKSAYVEDFVNKLHQHVQKSEGGGCFYNRNILVMFASKPK